MLVSRTSRAAVGTVAGGCPADRSANGEGAAVGAVAGGFPTNRSAEANIQSSRSRKAEEAAVTEPKATE